MTYKTEVIKQEFKTINGSFYILDSLLGNSGRINRKLLLSATFSLVCRVCLLRKSSQQNLQTWNQSKTCRPWNICKFMNLLFDFHGGFFSSNWSATAAGGFQCVTTCQIFNVYGGFNFQQLRLAGISILQFFLNHFLLTQERKNK